MSRDASNDSAKNPPSKSSPEKETDSRAPELEALGTEVRRLRLGRGLTLAELSSRTGLSPRFLISLEAGEGNISLLRLLELARALEVPAKELVALAESAATSIPQTRKPVVALLGLRGAGKTTVGTHLAEALGVRFVELDGLIAERAAMSLGMVFEMHGEAHFRKLERETLEAVLSEGKPLVLATGGSLVTAKDTYALLKRETHTVWLKARAEDHWSRVVAQGDGRPMKGRADAMNELRELLKSRAPLYGASEVTVDTQDRSVDEVVRELTSRFSDRTAPAPRRARTRAPTQRNMPRAR
jgi:XRE family aerobic/anaerobic benzoate catabolism transcriptional regulator